MEIARLSKDFKEVKKVFEAPEGYQLTIRDLPVVDEKPSFNSKYQQIKFSRYVVGTKQVTRIYNVTNSVSVDNIKNNLKTQVDSLRKFHEENSFTYGGDNYELDQLSLSRILTVAASKPNRVSWKPKGKPEKLLTGIQFKGLVDAASRHIQRLHDVARLHKTNIDALTKYDEVINYDIKTGW